MNYRIVSTSEIASHPYHSLLPAEYLGAPDHVKELLNRFQKSDRIRLHWMLERGIITTDQLRRYAAEIQARVLERPLRIAAEISHKVTDLLG